MPKEHFYHGNVHLALDPMNGEILALRNLATGDNLIKNAMCVNPETYVHQPFTFQLSDGENVTEYYPLHPREPLDNPEKKVTITSREVAEGLLIRVSYNRVTSQVIEAGRYIGDSSKELDMELYYTVLISDSSLQFQLHIQNTTGLTLTEVRFPVVAGVFLGEDHKDNVLAYPRTAGVKIDNPIEWFDREPNITYWRWNEYRYTYTDGIIRGDGAVAARGMKGYASTYPGQLSMSWMDLYNDEGGFYYGVHSADIQPVRLECGTYGKKCIGLNIAANYPVKVEPNQQYTTPPTVLAFHSGDWHEGAKLYRAFRLPLIQRCGDIMPQWAKKSVGLSAHYDFKIQDGTYFHTFKDIPQMARDSKSMGIDHMLFSGWNQDGFDNGYPLYYPDSELGTEEEFIQGIKEAKAMGVHVSLYENSQLYNLRYDKGDVQQNAVMGSDGKMTTQSWGINTFAVMCAMNPMWQDTISENLKRATRKYGVDGIYLDQFCNYQWCFNPNHRHNGDNWVAGRINTVLRCREEYQSAFGEPMLTMGEWVCDAYGGIMTYQLTQSFFGAQMGFYPDLFRYTFPEFGLMDMVYPKNVLMRPPQFAAREEILATCFANDTYLWLYHVTDDINFFKDERSLSLIREVNHLNSIKKEKFSDFWYVDTDGIYYDEAVARVRRFNKGNRVLLKYYRYKSADTSVTLSEKITKATAYTADDREYALEFSGNSVCLPKEKVALILIETESL